MQTREEALKLFRDNLALAYYARNRYARALEGYREITNEDIDQICLLGLWVAALRFCPARGLKFSTYAVSTVRGEMWKALKVVARRSMLHTVSMDHIDIFADCNESTQPRNVPDPANVEEETCAAVACKAFTQSQPDRYRLVLAFRNAGMHQDEIGRAVGFSQVHVSRILHKLARQYAASLG